MVSETYGTEITFVKAHIVKQWVTYKEVANIDCPLLSYSMDSVNSYWGNECMFTLIRKGISTLVFGRGIPPTIHLRAL